MNIFVRSAAVVPRVPSSSTTTIMSSKSLVSTLALVVAIAVVAVPAYAAAPKAAVAPADFVYKGSLILTTGEYTNYYKDQFHVSVNPNTGEWKYLCCT
jgi:hypothetical protein